MNESHVEHAVGFIEHQMSNLRQVCSPLLDEIEQPTRRGDEQITALTQAVDLRALADAAEHDQRS